METIRYVHVADLHLDTPFKGIARLDPHLGQKLANAPFIALKRLEQVCVAQKPDFVVIAGDLYNEEDHSIRAQLKLREFCAKLEENGIPVFIAHGNHDPLSSRISSIIWPANTHIFGSSPESRILEKEGQPVALIHGISHEKNPEGRNLAATLKRDQAYDCFQLGVVHCNLNGSSDDGQYAPCSLSDLTESGLDAFALGHIHNRRVEATRPFAAYSGDIQGLDYTETGERGCFLVTATRTGDGWECTPEFHPLAPVIWETIQVDIDGVSAFDEVEARISASVANPGLKSGETTILDIVAGGRTELHAVLMSDDAIEEYTRIAQNSAPEGFAIRKVEFATAPVISLEENLDRDDLLGEISRLCRDMAQDRMRFEQALRLARKPLERWHRGLISLPPIEDMEAFLNQAQRICQDHLEGR